MQDKQQNLRNCIYYNNQHHSIYVGSIVNHQFHGRGIEIFPDKKIVGEFFHGNKSGSVFEVESNGLTQSWQMIYGCQCGYGILIRRSISKNLHSNYYIQLLAADSVIMYIGYMIDGQPHGYGTLSSTVGLVKGIFWKGYPIHCYILKNNLVALVGSYAIKSQCLGTMIQNNISLYSGSFKDMAINGMGIIQNVNQQGETIQSIKGFIRKSRWIENGLVVTPSSIVLGSAQARQPGYVTYLQYNDESLYCGEYYNSQAVGYGIQYNKQTESEYQGIYKGYFSDGYRTLGVVSNHILQYEGYFKSNIFHGNGFMIKKDILYKGEWRNGKENGSGIEITDEYEYDGEFKDGIRWGSCIVKLQNGHKYTGSWLEDNPHGLGILFRSDRQIYHGDWKYGLLSTNVTFNDTPGKYNYQQINQLSSSYIKDPFIIEEENSIFIQSSRPNESSIQYASQLDQYFNRHIEQKYSNNSLSSESYYKGMENKDYGLIEREYEWISMQSKKYHGRFVHKSSYGDIKTDEGNRRFMLQSGHCGYDGNFYNNQKHGFDIVQRFGFRSQDDEYYKGDLLNGVYHGKGILNKSGEKYEGNFLSGQRYWYGQHYLQDGSSYLGYWDQNQLNGWGVYETSKRIIYKGQFKNGKFHGVGILQFENNIVVGRFQNDKISGTNVRWSSGSLIFHNLQLNLISAEFIVVNKDGQIFEGIRTDNKIQFYKLNQYSLPSTSWNYTQEKENRLDLQLISQSLYQRPSSPEEQSQIYEEQQYCLQPQFSFPQPPKAFFEYRCKALQHNSKLIFYYLPNAPDNQAYSRTLKENEILLGQYDDKYYLIKKGFIYYGDFIHQDIFQTLVVNDRWFLGGKFGQEILGSELRSDGAFSVGSFSLLGMGCIIYPQGDRYMGQWIVKKNHQVMHGFGVYYWPKVIYVGNWYNGKPESQGSIIFLNEQVLYSGDFEEGLKHGFGVYVRRVGKSYKLYKGIWAKDQFIDKLDS